MATPIPIAANTTPRTEGTNDAVWAGPSLSLTLPTQRAIERAPDRRLLIDVRRVICSGGPTSNTLQGFSKLGHDRLRQASAEPVLLP
jgi:hypothetical protein